MTATDKCLQPPTIPPQSFGTNRKSVIFCKLRAHFSNKGLWQQLTWCYFFIDLLSCLADTKSGQINQTKLALLISICVQIPRQLGELASFGGANIDPSVQSCLEQVGGNSFSLSMVGLRSSSMFTGCPCLPCWLRAGW